MGKAAGRVPATIPSAALEESKGQRPRPAPAQGARIGAKWVPARSKATRCGGAAALGLVILRFLLGSCGPESMAAWRRAALPGKRVGNSQQRGAGPQAGAVLDVDVID